MKTTERFGRPAFTLIELMVVITITVILASLVVLGFSYVGERQNRQTAELQIALLTKALESYKQDHGVYPPSADAVKPTGQSQVLFNALYWDSDNDGVGGPADTDQKVYLADLNPLTSKLKWTTGTPSSATRITDPWGNEYLYRSAGNLAGTGTNTATVNTDFDLWSMGKDGDTRGGSSVPDLRDPKNRDDIRNFNPPIAMSFAR